MPSFVCDFCQETLKKAKLDQHAQRCRQAAFSCIDCYKTFKGTEYRDHTSCITEVEKYHKIKPKTPAAQNGTKADAKLQPVASQTQVEKSDKVVEPAAKKSKSSSTTPKDLLLGKLSKESANLYSVLKAIKKGKEPKALRKETKKWILSKIQLTLGSNGSPTVKFSP